MELNLRGRTALITGASKGIGKAVAIGLAAEGCNVHLVARSADTLRELSEKISQEFGVAAHVHAYDIAEVTSASRLAATAGPIDLLVNNAGAIPRGNLEEVTEERWREGWELKVFGYIRLCRTFYPIMCERRAGVIINVIGVSGERPDANYIATCTANSGLMMFSEALGGESVSHGVRVVGINPGIVATDRFMGNVKRRALKLFGDEGRWQDMLIDLPIGRLAQPEEIADAVIFLASDRASYISGVTITVDGGLKSRPPSGI